MDEAERQRRDARAIGCLYRLKYAIGGFGVTLLAVVGTAFMISGGPPDDGRDHGPWPWVGIGAAWLVGSLLLWEASRRSPRDE